jgi:hypothetical protein
MSTLLFGRSGRVLAYRSTPGQPGSFESKNPQFFDHQPNGIEISDLRFEFDIEKSVDKEPNKCQVKITNCNENTRAFLCAKPLTVLVQAGYQGTLRYLFKGDLRYGFSTHDGPDWITTLQLADGDRAYRYAQITKSYRKGSLFMQVLGDAAKSMGLSLDAQTTGSDLAAQGFPGGHTLDGNTRDELSRLLAPYGYTWSIQNGRLQILRDNQTRQDAAIVINESTGMINSPESAAPEDTKKPPTLKIKHLLYPELTPGARIYVQSQAVSGTFRIEKVHHTGGTADDDDWFTEIEATKAS